MDDRDAKWHMAHGWDARCPNYSDCSFVAGEVYILASTKSMVQSNSGKLYKLVDPKRYGHLALFSLFFSEILVTNDSCNFSVVLPNRESVTLGSAKA